MNALEILDALHSFVMQSEKENKEEGIILQSLKEKLAELDTRDKPYKIIIEQTDAYDSPREWDNMGVMVCWHHRYNLGDNDGLSTLWSDLRASKAYKDSWEDYEWRDPSDLHEMAVKAGFLIQELYLYDHSGIAMSTSPFSCRWDSGQVGFIYTTREAIRDNYGITRITKKFYDRAMKILESEVDVYDQYLQGDVYGFVVEDAFGEHIDSCCGFFGSDIEKNGMVDYFPENWQALEIEKPAYM